MITITLLRKPAVLARTGLSHSRLYRRITDGLFPAPVNDGSKCVVWPDNEIAAVNAAVVAGKTDSEIRDLVKMLKEKRASALDEALAGSDERLRGGLGGET